MRGGAGGGPPVSNSSGGQQSDGPSSGQQAKNDPMSFISEQFPEVGALYQMAPGYSGLPPAGESMQSYIESITKPEVQEQILAAERTYGPQYAALQLGGMEDFLFGTGGQRGLLDIQEEAAGQAIAGMREAKPQATALAESQAQQAAQLQDFATRRMEASLGLSPEEQRLAQQRALSTAEAQGRVRDTSALAAELLGREEILGTRRAEALQAQQAAMGSRATAYDMEQGISGNIGGTVLGQAAGMQSALGPQLFDPNVGVNLALQDLQNQVNFQSSMFGTQASLLGSAIGAQAQLQGAEAAASAQRSAGMMGGLGSLAGGLFSGAGAAGGFGALFSSDIRFKEDIKETGELPSGLRTYTFRYKGGETTYEGVMAQEAILTHPRAVHDLGGGFLGVDYSMID